MKERKGFTLVELLAVIVVLGILLIIAVPSVTKIVESSKKKAFISEVKLFANSAKQHISLDKEGEINEESKNICYDEIDDGEINKSNTTIKGCATVNKDSVTMNLCNNDYCIIGKDANNITTEDLINPKNIIKEQTINDDKDVSDEVFKYYAKEFLEQSIKYNVDNSNDEGEAGYTKYDENGSTISICIDYEELAKEGYLNKIDNYKGYTIIDINNSDNSTAHFYNGNSYYIAPTSNDDSSTITDGYNKNDKLEIQSFNADKTVELCQSLYGYSKRLISKKEVLNILTTSYKKEYGNINIINNKKDCSIINNSKATYKMYSYFTKSGVISSYVAFDDGGYYLIGSSIIDGKINTLACPNPDRNYSNCLFVTNSNINLSSIEYYTGTVSGDDFGCLED